MRDNSQMLSQNGLISSKKAIWTYLLCVVLFSGFALFATYCDLYVFNQFTVMQATVSKLDIEDTFAIFEHNRDYFPRNQVVVNLLAAILCFGYIKRDTKNYAIGLTPASDLKFGIPSIVMLVIAVCYGLIKIAWKDMQTFGLNMLLQAVAMAAFVALGVYLMRKAGASYQAKALIPLISGLLVLPFAFGIMVNSFTLTEVEMLVFADVLNNSLIVNAIPVAVLAFLPGLIFTVGYYCFSNDLLGGISLSYLISMMTVSMALNVAKETPVVTNFTIIGRFVFLALAIGGGIACIVYIFVKKGMSSDEECEYEARVYGEGSIYDSKEDEMRHSVETIIAAFAGLVAVAFVFGSMVWYNAESFFNAIMNFFEWVLGAGKLTSDFNFWVLLPMLPLVLCVIAFCLFCLGKKSKTFHAGSVLVRLGGLTLLAGDALVLTLMAVLGKDGFVKKFSPLTYVWNAALYDMESMDMLPAIFTIALLAGVAVLTLYHLCVFFSAEGMLFARRIPKIVYIVAFAGSAVIGALLVAIALFAMQGLAMIATTLGGVACVAVGLIIHKYAIKA